MDEIKTPCLLYDEQCPLCKRFAQSLQRIHLKTKIHYYSIYNEEVYKQLPFLNKDEVFDEVHLVLAANKSAVLRGSHAVQFLASENPAVKKFAWLIESEMGQKAMDVFYTGLNKCRKTLHVRCPKCKNRKRISL
ncbi:MAG: hypothetical protein CME60_01995 [Halobacteriovoraceae bacterium]|jgi:predicted DCC family thiol-disulfide oxidoreductase YuxK|nr:hypothetical protein [Halobacteriovoraceae bacterium]